MPRDFLHHNAALSFQRRFELLAIQTERFGGQHVFMSTVDRVLCNVPSNIRPPTFQSRRTRNPVIRQSRKNDYITIENTGFVSSMQCKATIKIVNTQIEKLLVLRKFRPPVRAPARPHLLVGKRTILFWDIYTIEPQDFFQCLGLD